MADYVWPSALAPYAMTFYMQHQSTVTESPFTRQVQVLGRSAPRWVAKMSLRGGAGGTANNHGVGGQIEALLLQLRGPQKTVTLFDWRRPEGKGVVVSYATYGATIAETIFTDSTDFTDNTQFSLVSTDTPSNYATPAGSESVYFSGFSPATYPRYVGDYVGFGDGRPHMVTVAPATDQNGRVTLTFYPPLASAIAAGVYTFSEVRGTFRLTSDDAGNNPTDLSGLGMYELDFIEVLPVA